MKESLLRDRILETIKAFGRKRIRRRQLYNLMKIKGVSYDEFKNVLGNMESEGVLVRAKGSRFALPEKSDILTGVFSAISSGGGFIKTESGESVYVGRNHTNGALDGDTVQAKPMKRQRPGYSRAARVMKIIERTTRPIVGIFHEQGKVRYILPEEEGVTGSILVKADETGGAEPGLMVLARLEMPESGYSRPLCTIVEVLGKPDDPGMDVLVIAKRHQLPMQFPPEVGEYVDSLPDEVDPADMEGRRDIRSEVVFTIDPVDARDFDDAISISKDGRGHYHLGVHIADVAHYVDMDSALDEEAAVRGMSVYLVDRVIPMLPEKLSNNLCSLNPDTDRLTKSMFAVLDGEGNVLSHEVANTVIHSSMRLTYEQVQAYLDGSDEHDAGKVTKDVGDRLRLFGELSDMLIARRRERGAFDMEMPETRVVLGDDGKPVDIVRRERLKAHRMIEEAMILANILTARTLAGSNTTFLYRVHERPDPEKMTSFAEIATRLGYEFHESKADDQQYIQQFLQSLKGKRHERILNVLLLRSLKKAKYAPENAGHYGLALEEYAHFTSPIRRYPDLLMHRQFDRFFFADSPPKDRHSLEYYRTLGSTVTEREINADAAERESVKMKTAEFMQQYIGEEFDGTISGMLPIGFFVELDDMFVEGLVHVNTLTDDYFEVDRTGVAMTGRRTGKTFTVGDRVRIQVLKADKEKGEIDFMVIEEKKQGKKKAKRKYGR